MCKVRERVEPQWVSSGNEWSLTGLGRGTSGA